MDAFSSDVTIVKRDVVEGGHSGSHICPYNCILEIHVIVALSSEITSDLGGLITYRH